MFPLLTFDVISLGGVLVLSLNGGGGIAPLPLVSLLALVGVGAIFAGFGYLEDIIGSGMTIASGGVEYAGSVRDRSSTPGRGLAELDLEWSKEPDLGVPAESGVPGEDIS